MSKTRVIGLTIFEHAKNTNCGLNQGKANVVSKVDEST